MNRNLARTAILLMLVATLSACSMFTAPNANRLSLGLTPTNELGYEVDTSGVITITTRNLVLATRAGQPLTTVTGYHLDYFNQSDVIVGSTGADARSLNITVPAGFTCTNPAPVVGCDSFSEGARPGPGVAVEVEGLSSQLLNVDIAEAHLAAGRPTGWYTVLTLYYNNANGAFAEEYTLAIVAPN